MRTTYIATPDGVFTAHFSKQGLARLEFPARGKQPAPTVLTPALAPPEFRARHLLVETALRRALLGQLPEAWPALDLSAGRSFQRRVWEVLRTIPPGRTMTYGEVAAAVGRPTALRATGGACGANPVPVLIPCHRVLAAHGGLGGFSGGLEWKKKLLEREGVLAPPLL